MSELGPAVDLAIFVTAAVGFLLVVFFSIDGRRKH